MFSQKVKRVISIMLIISMTFCCNGFSVLAGSVEGVVEENQIASSEKQTPNYYYEYQQYSEEKIILTSNENNNKGDSEAPGDVANDNLGGDEKLTDGESNNDSDSFDAPSDDEENSSNEEEPEDDETTTTVNEEESTTETSAEESESTTETSVEESESTTETSVEESESTTETSVEESETTTETKVEESESTTETTFEGTTTKEVEESTTKVVVPEENETATTANDEETTKSDDNNIEESETTKASVDNIDDVKTKTIIDFENATTSDAEEEVRVVKKYIYATRSIPEDSVWTLKEILANDVTGSFKELPRNEVIKEKYLAKTVKVLVENQYGDQKVVTVPAKWDIEVLSKVYRPEGFVPNKNDYKADKDGKIYEIGEDGKEREIKFEEESEDATAKDDAVAEEDDAILASEEDSATNVNSEEVKDTENKEEENKEEENKGEDTKNDEDTDIAPTTKEEVNNEENMEPTVAGFTNSDEENANDGEEQQNTENNAIDNSKENDDDHDTSIDDGKVEYEYETVTDDTPIKPDDDELDKTNVIIGNANNGVVNHENAQEEAAAEINLAELTKNLAELLGGEIIVPHGSGFDVLFGAGDPHNHWVCGRANCSDSARYHFNENMNTTHPVSGQKTYQAINSITEFENAINSGVAQYDYLYLTADITIDKMIKVTRPLFLCLNDHTISFNASGQLCTYYDYKAPNPDLHGSYPYAMCFCGCADDNGAADGYCGTLDGGGITQQRKAPAIFYTKNEGVYFYGLGSNDAGDTVASDYKDTGAGAGKETRLRIQNFAFDYLNVNHGKYQAPQAQRENEASTEVYSYPNNPLYNGNTPSTDTTSGGVEDDMYKTYTSAFLCMSINDKGQAETQTTRRAFFYALDVYSVYAHDGGFANLYYLNSFAMEHCKINTVGAFRGGIVSADFNNRRFLNNTDTSVNNDYIDIGHNNITGAELGCTSNAGHNDTWGTAGKYGNGATAIAPAGTTLMDTDVVYSPDKNGLFLLENYNGGSTDEKYRIIKGNTFTGNTTGGADDTNKTSQLIFLTMYLIIIEVVQYT